MSRLQGSGLESSVTIIALLVMKVPGNRLTLAARLGIHRVSSIL
jgi:hypothetical protein